MRHKKIAELSPESKKTRAVFTAILISLIVVLLVGVYLRFAWNRYENMAQSEALQLARSVESLLHVEHIAALRSDDYMQGISEHSLVEESLAQLVKTSDLIYYAYILKQQNGDVFVVADSVSDSEPSGVIDDDCEEMVEIKWRDLEAGQSLIIGLTSPLCENWISTLVPIFDADNNRVIAALGLSYSAKEWQANIWKSMSADFIIISCVLVLVFAFLSIRQKNFKLKKTAADLAFQEALYRNIFEQAPIGIILQGGKEQLTGAEYISINPMGEAILGMPFEDMKKMDWRDLTPEEDLKVELPLYERFAKNEISSYSMEKRLIKPDGSITWVNLKVADISSGEQYKSLYLCLLEDISARKESEEWLWESERSKAVFLSHLPGMAYRSKFDEHWTMEFVSEGCYELTGYKAESIIGNQDISYNEIISPEYRDAVRSEREKALFNHRHYHHEYEIITKSGERKWVLARGRGIYNDAGEVEALEGVVLDISEQKKKEHQITYLRNHDFLTGLYNRNHIEREKIRLDHPVFLPLSVAICDIDALRMINDAYGHEEGDRMIVKTAKLIQGCLPSEYVLGHVGGGEFIVLLPNTDSKMAHQISSDIVHTIESYNRANANALYTISLSIGHGTKETPEQKLQDVIIDAEDYLQRRKLINQNSSHSTIVSAIMSTLYAKSQETEKHGQRLGLLCRKIGEALGLEQKDHDALQLVSKLHDIGKIGIDDYILNKPDKLSQEEWNIMKKHPEIGYRIAISTAQLEHVADYILYHHERWDGKGYPKGLKGEEIPLVSRILAVADAFDAMTEDRIYQKALSREEAIEEIRRNAGSQFDPDITRLFVDLMEKNKDI